jgi:hypothetical protein
MWNPNVEDASWDIAIMLLDRVPPATPRPIARTPPAAGQTLVIAGYGRDNPSQPNSSGTRRIATASITAVQSESFGLGVSGTLGICGGDSGGPSLRTFPDGIERIVGLHSTTPNLAVCGDGMDTRVDVHAAFIDAFLAQKDPPPVPDGGAGGGAAGGSAGGSAGGAAGGAGGAAGGTAGGSAGGTAGGSAGGATGGGVEPPGGCGCSVSPLPLVLLALLPARRSGRLGFRSPCSADSP